MVIKFYEKMALVATLNKNSLVPYMVKLNPLIPKNTLLSVDENSPPSLMALRIYSPVEPAIVV